MDRSSISRGRATKQKKMELYPRYSQALGNGRQASMERLNDILTRAMQRRQHIPEPPERSERYPTQGAIPHDGEVQRQRMPPPQSSHGSLPLREQRAHLGRPNPYGTPLQNGQPLTRRYGTPGQQGQGELHQGGTRPPTAPTSRPTHPRSQLDTPTPS